MGGGGGQNSEIAQQQLMLAQQQNAQLQQQNREKKQNIAAGDKAISGAFAQFNPDYYNKFQQANIDAQAIPLADQYSRAKDKEAASLASRGIGQSSVGAQGQADIDQLNAQTLGKISNDAANAVNTQKSAVSNAQTNLYNLNAAGNDPSGVSANAIGAASSLVNPAPQGQLGNVFASLLTPVANYYKAGVGSLQAPTSFS
jgi:hypothetical protein